MAVMQQPDLSLLRGGAAPFEMASQHSHGSVGGTVGGSQPALYPHGSLGGPQVTSSVASSVPQPGALGPNPTFGQGPAGSAALQALAQQRGFANYGAMSQAARQPYYQDVNTAARIPLSMEQFRQMSGGQMGVPGYGGPGTTQSFQPSQQATPQSQAAGQVQQQQQAQPQMQQQQMLVQLLRALMQRGQMGGGQIGGGIGQGYQQWQQPSAYNYGGYFMPQQNGYYTGGYAPGYQQYQQQYGQQQNPYQSYNQTPGWGYNMSSQWGSQPGGSATTMEYRPQGYFNTFPSGIQNVLNNWQRANSGGMQLF